MLSRGARESRDNVSGLSIGLREMQTSSIIDHGLILRLADLFSGHENRSRDCSKASACGKSSQNGVGTWKERLRKRNSRLSFRLSSRLLHLA